MSRETLREQYEKASQLGKPAFIERPLIGSPAAPAQAQTNASNLWGQLNAGMLIAYEYTRWWKESQALRRAAVLGDWSWLNKTRISGRDAARFLDYASVRGFARRRPGQIVYAPMVDARGKVALEGLAWVLGDAEFLYTQSGALKWLEQLRERCGMDVALEDVTPEYTCYALQGPRSTEVLEQLTGAAWRELGFSRWRRARLLGADVLVGRQGVTGEVGYEFLMPTEGGNAHELWQRIRDAGAPLGLRELGFKAQMIGHTETGIATVLRDFLPARGSPEALGRMLRFWMSAEELAAAPWRVEDHLCSPAELGWAHTIDLARPDFHGRAALAAEAAAGGPARRLLGLEWSSEDVAALYAAQFADAPAAPPPDLPAGQFRVFFMPVTQGGRAAGWASGWAYSPTLRRVVSLARLERTLAPGAEVEVRWGGFSDEPVARIRARVAALPFIRQHRADDLSRSG